MIDLLNAQKEFKNYLKDYNIEDERVKLKVTHTYGVVDASRYLSNKLNLNEEDTKLSELIALLHDIGRFEQSKVIENVFDKADTKYFDHAEFGVKILFEDNLIRKFIADSSYDNIIYKAILNHNKYKIEDNLKEKELLHAKLIRDNDKTDNFRVNFKASINFFRLKTFPSPFIGSSFCKSNFEGVAINPNCIQLAANAKTKTNKYMGDKAFTSVVATVTVIVKYVLSSISCPIKP